MAITFNCPHCNASIRVADGAAGKHGDCVKCGQRLQIPTASSGTQQLPDRSLPVQHAVPAAEPISDNTALAEDPLAAFNFSNDSPPPASKHSVVKPTEPAKVANGSGIGCIRVANGCAIVFLVIFVIGVIVGFSLRSGNKGINQEAYYKNQTAKGTVRVFTFSYKPDITKADIHRHCRSLSHTSGGVTEAYYYPDGASIPRDGITLAKSLVEVWAVMERFPGWTFHYIVLPSGSGELSENK